MSLNCISFNFYVRVIVGAGEVIGNYGIYFSLVKQSTFISFGYVHLFTLRLIYYLLQLFLYSVVGKFIKLFY